MWSWKPVETKRQGETFYAQTKQQQISPNSKQFRYKLQFQKESKKELAESRERAHNPIQVIRNIKLYRIIHLIFDYSCTWVKRAHNPIQVILKKHQTLQNQSSYIWLSEYLSKTCSQPNPSILSRIRSNHILTSDSKKLSLINFRSHISSHILSESGGPECPKWTFLWRKCPRLSTEASVEGGLGRSRVYFFEKTRSQRSTLSRAKSGLSRVSRNTFENTARWRFFSDKSLKEKN